MRAAVALAVGAATVLAGCSTADDERAEERAGALAAAQAYVDAIAARDPEAADAMTDPEAFQYVGDGDANDIREALRDAADPIADPWVSIASTGSDYEYGSVAYVVEVSYTLGDLTGGDTIELELATDGDPSDVGDWTVTEPLIAQRPTWSTIPTARVGDLEIPYVDELAYLEGYPAGYLLEPAEPAADVEPLWVPVGAADAPPWDDALPKLGGRTNA